MAKFDLYQVALALIDPELAAVKGGEAKAGQLSVSGFHVDSRHVTPGSAFVALQGERTDGHLYVADAFEQGAACAIVGRPSGGATLDLRGIGQSDLDQVWSSVQAPVSIVVDDPLAGLQKIACWWRKRWGTEMQPGGRVIGITGSVGKTTTKELVSSVLEQGYVVLRSKGNYNNEIGLPLTLLDLEPEHERVVLEMGTYGLGEIALLAEIAQPHVGVVTNVGPVHLERMGSLERIAQAKAELVQGLTSDGVAVLNADDERVRAMGKVAPGQVFLYGLQAGCDLRADEVTSRGLEGVRARFHYQGKTLYVHIPLLGRHSVHTALRAASVGLIEGLSWEAIVPGLRAGEQLRLVIVPAVNGATLIDDTYNSSPDSAIAALNLMDELDGHKIAVLGDMLELGGYEVEGHRRVGRRARDAVSLLITVGELGGLIAKAALEYGMAPECVISVETKAQATERLQELLSEGDIVLVKGSRGMAMESIVEALARPPANGVPAPERSS